MDRKQELTRFAGLGAPGIEVAPWFRPLVPRAEGYHSHTLDIFDRDTLAENAAAAGLGNVADQIEEVTFVGSAVDIQALVQRSFPGRTFHYVLSSHNFEHLPDPVKFLQGCAAVLVEGGHLSMAVPDKRCTFDFFRPVSTTADLLAAFVEKRTRPTLAQIFEQLSLEGALVDDGGSLRIGFSLEADPARVHPAERLGEAYEAWQAQHARVDPPYQDAHCWTFTPASFELIVRDLRFLGLVDLDIVSVSPAIGNEFFVHLRAGATAVAENFYARRKQLLQAMLREAAQAVP